MYRLPVKLNPFHGLPNQREVISWGLFDLANQSFTLLIITLLFSLYVRGVVTVQPTLAPDVAQQVAAVEAGEAEATPELTQVKADHAAAVIAAERRGSWHWSLLHGSSLLLVVVLSPVVGALADARGLRKQFLIGTGVCCALLTCSLGLVGPGMLLIAALLYIPANLCYQIGENFLASFLPSISTPRNIGRISATGWTMGYVGALLLLICCIAMMLGFNLKTPDQWRPLFVFAGVWFFVGIIPAALFLRDDTPDPAAAGRPLLREALGRVATTLRHAGQYRQLAVFLFAFLVFAFGVQTIIGFASIIAASFGFEQTHLILFVAQLTVVAGLAAALTSRFQDRIGAKNTALAYLVVWIASCAGLIAIRHIWPASGPPGPQWPVWVVGNGLGLGLGGIGTASRSLVGRFTPRHRAAEFFGLWGMVYKLAGAIGVLSFGAVAALFGQLASLYLLLAFFVVGGLLVLPVRETAGVRAAARAERDHAARANVGQRT